MTSKRFTTRAAAIAAFDLPYELLAPELFFLLAHDAKLSAASCSYVVDVKGQDAGNFRVLNGSEGTTEALRALRSAGYWPAPSTFPAIERIAAEGRAQRAYTGALWGEACAEDGPWGPMWKERGVRFAYMLTAISSAGLGAIGLFNCGPDRPATARQLAMGEAISQLVADILDRPAPPQPGPLALLKESQLAFGADGSLSALGVDSAEMLRDAGGGGAGAVARMRRRTEDVAAALLRELASRHEPEVVGGPKDEEALRRGLFRLREQGPKPVIRAELAISNFGRFELALTAAVGPDGDWRALGALRQFAPRAVALIRAASVMNAPGREIELVRRLDEGAAMGEAATAMGVTLNTAETLANRIAARFDVRGRNALLERMAEVGRDARR